MKRLIYLFCIFILITSSCNKKSKKDIDLTKLKTELNLTLMSFYLDKDDFFNNQYNQKSIDKSLILLDSLLILSKSEKIYFYSLIKSKVLFLYDNEKESLKELKSISEVNPLLYHYYIGIMKELKGNQNMAIEEYKLAKNLCKNKQDALCLEIQFLIDNNIQVFLSDMARIDLGLFKKLNDLKEKEEINNVRKSIIISELYDNYIMPNDD